MIKYLCPLCNQQSAYGSAGMPNVVVCKCQGLKEVGTIENHKYIPRIFVESKHFDDKIELFIHQDIAFAKIKSLEELIRIVANYEIKHLKDHSILLNQFDHHFFWVAVAPNNANNVFIKIDKKVHKINMICYRSEKCLDVQSEQFYHNIMKKHNVID